MNAKSGGLLKQSLEERLSAALEGRRSQGILRTLTKPDEGLIDFVSNDYLGFARLPAGDISSPAGSTGSRLISGTAPIHRELEECAASFHSGESAILFNSGYDANLAVASSLLSRHDTVIYDELAHASIRDGVRLSAATGWSFGHNSVEDLDKKLALARGIALVIVESVYPMDGDVAPLGELVGVCERHGARLIVDEAHATGVFGERGEGVVVGEGLADRVFGRVHSFGKALGTHGAVVVGPTVLTDYLVNFARSFIYTTALPPVNVEHTLDRYRRLKQGAEESSRLRKVIREFQDILRGFPVLREKIHPTPTPIQRIILGSNDVTRDAAQHLRECGIAAYPVLSPTVRAGSERLRICLHAYNTRQEIENLLESLGQFLGASSR